MTEIPDDVRAQLHRLSTELAHRGAKHLQLENYYEGNAPPPQAVRDSKLTKAYRQFMPLADAPWASIPVDSVQDRLEVAGIRSGDRGVDDAVWGAWQDNRMDSESKLIHNSALISGRAFALVWPGEDGRPQISLDSSAQMVVAYQEGSRHHRVAALRQWFDDDGVMHATLYRPDGLFKFTGRGGSGWIPREVRGEEWPAPNPYGVVPVVELAVNPRLKPGSLGHARGEYEHCLGLLDKIHLLSFVDLIVAFWMGFPLRGVMGAKILYDDDGKAIAPFDADADSIFHIEGEHAKIAEFKAADRKSLRVHPELAQFAYITKTPAHYFPLESGISNISADAIRALEGGNAAKVSGHKAFLGEGHEEVLRLTGMMLPDPVELSPRAELLWHSHEARSIAERADAATKVASIGFPWQFIAEHYLDVTGEEISRIEAMVAGSALGDLLRAPVPSPAEEEASANGGVPANGGIS